MLSGKRVAIITGGTGNLGKGIAYRLAKDGVNVVITGKNRDGTELCNELKRDFNIEALFFFMDVIVIESVNAVVDKVLNRFGKIDILVNAAGIKRDELFLKMNESYFDELFKVNITGVANVTKPVLKSMIKNRSGSVINISSVAAIKPNIGQANYAASKAGLVAMSKTVALEVARFGVTVNAILPGFLEGGMTDSLEVEKVEQLLKAIPLGRFGKIEEVADLVLFLTEARYITGQAIIIDGALTL